MIGGSATESSPEEFSVVSSSESDCSSGMVWLFCISFSVQFIALCSTDLELISDSAPLLHLMCFLSNLIIPCSSIESKIKALGIYDLSVASRIDIYPLA